MKKESESGVRGQRPRPLQNIRECRDAAWQLLWKGQWLRRFVWIIVLFGMIRYIAINIAVALLGSSQAAVAERLTKIETPDELIAIFHDAAFLRTFAIIALLTTFVGVVVDSIGAFGLSRLRIAAVRKAPLSAKWYADAFVGFRDPFGMFALTALRDVFVMWPVVLVLAIVTAHTALMDGTVQTLHYAAVLAGAFLSLVNFYRYRLAWFVKAEKPEASALKCLRESSAMMKGNVVACFRLDCALWRPITVFLTFVLLATMALLFGGSQMLVILLAVAITAMSLYLQSYIPLAIAEFYRRVRNEE